MRAPLASLIGHGFWYALGNAIGKAGGLLLLPIFTNGTYLEPDDYGRWGVLEVTVQLGVIIVGLQLGLAVLRFFADTEDRDSAGASAFWSLVIFLTTLGLLGALFVVPYLDAFWRPIATWLFVYVASETLLTIPLSILRAAGKAHTYTLMLVVRLALVIGLMMWLLVGRGMGLNGVVAGYALASLGTLLVSIPSSNSIIRLRPHIRRELVARMLRFSVPLVLAGLGSMALNAADRYVLIAMRSADDVALYTLAVKFGGVVNMFAAQPLQLALFPVLFQVAADQRAWLVRSLTRISALVFGLLTVVLVLFSEPVIVLMGADPFYRDSSGLIAWIALGFGVFGIGMIYDGVLILFKKTGQTSLWFTIAAVANILLNIAVIPWLGALGAAITTLVSYGILLGGRVWAARGLLVVGHDLTPLIGISVVTVAVCLALSAIGPGVGVAGLAVRLSMLIGWVGVVLLARWVNIDDIRAAMRLARTRTDGNDAIESR